MHRNTRFALGLLAGVALAAMGAAWSVTDRADALPGALQAIAEVAGPADAPDPAGGDAAVRAEAGAGGHAIIVRTGDNSPVRIVIGDNAPPAVEASAGAGAPDGSADIDSPDGSADIDSGDGDPARAAASAGPLDEGARSGSPASPAGEPGAALPVGPLMEHEGLSLNPYELAGSIHVCYGHNLSASGGLVVDRGLRDCIDLLHADMLSAHHAALDAVGEDAWLDMTAIQQGAVIELAYMTGGGGISKFREFLAALRRGDWLQAAVELQFSLLPGQIGAGRLADLMARIVQP